MRTDPTMNTPDTGQNAPAFSLPADDGSEVSLSDLKGKIVVLYFYPKDDTPGCTTEAIDFSSHIAAFADNGAVVIGVSKDSVKKHQNFTSGNTNSTFYGSSVSNVIWMAVNSGASIGSFFSRII